MSASAAETLDITVAATNVKQIQNETEGYNIPGCNILVATGNRFLWTSGATIAFERRQAHALPEAREGHNVIPKRIDLDGETTLAQVIAQSFDLCSLARAVDSGKGDNLHIRRSHKSFSGARQLLKHGTISEPRAVCSERLQSMRSPFPGRPLLRRLRQPSAQSYELSAALPEQSRRPQVVPR